MFINLLLQAVSGAASAEVMNLLEKFRELNGDDKYKQLVIALRNSFELLQDVVDKTKTKIDDTLVGIILKGLPELDFEETASVVGGTEESKSIPMAKDESE